MLQEIEPCRGRQQQRCGGRRVREHAKRTEHKSKQNSQNCRRMPIRLSGKKFADACFQAAEIHARNYKQKSRQQKHANQKRCKRYLLRIQIRQYSEQRCQKHGYTGTNNLPHGMGVVFHRIPPVEVLLLILS